MTRPPSRHTGGDHNEIADTNEILRVIVGSQVHGIAIEGTDDRDEMGVFVEPPEHVLGVGDQMNTITWRTQPEGHRSGPGDTDRVRYSLRHYLRLVLKGNPNVLLPLFAPKDMILVTTELGEKMRNKRDIFLSQRAIRQTLGYMNAQVERMVNQRKLPNRPELIEKYGYDCYLDDTEFLTRRGWLTYDEIEDEDIATVDHIGRIEFQRPIERIAKPYAGPILFGHTRYSSWAVTPNHRMWVSKIERGACGVNGDQYVQERARWHFRRADTIQVTSWHMRVAGAPRVAEYPVADAYLALIGAYVSEGCVGKRLTDGSASVLRFEQKDGGRLHPIMEVVGARWPLRCYCYPARPRVTLWTLADRQVANDVAKSCGIGSRNKRLPGWTADLSARQADVLLDVLLAGDGTSCRTGGWIYYTTSPRLAGDVQALAVAAGRRCNVWGPYDVGMYQVFIADRQSDREIEGFRARQHLRVEQVTDRRIVCFTVSNERLITRRDGRVAMHGNTKFASHAVRLAIQGLELAQSGTLTLPMRESDRELVLAVKTGHYAQEQVVRMVETYDREISAVMGADRCPLPPKPNLKRINNWAIRAHNSYWSGHGYHLWASE